MKKSRALLAITLVVVLCFSTLVINADAARINDDIIFLKQVSEETSR